jgi:hypothetical protein
VNVEVRYADGKGESVGSVDLPIGEIGYVRVCKLWQLEDKPLASVTVFVVARPISHGFGTL